MGIAKGTGMVKISDFLNMWGDDAFFVIRTKNMTVRARKSVLLSETLCSLFLEMYAFNVIIRQNEDGEDLVYIHAQEEAAA